MKPKLSIVIPTYYTDYTKQLFLKDVLISIIHCYGFSDDIEIIVVENPKKTEFVDHIIKDSLHNRKYNIIHTSSELGANCARNCGIQIAKSDIIALLDDDCVVERGWIESILASHQLYPEVGVIGGSMKLVFKTNKPRWIQGYFTQCLAEVDHGEGVVDLSHINDSYLGMIVSGNLTFKKAIYNKTHGFNEKLGYIGNNCMAQDEIEFITECHKFGKPGRLYIGRIMVYHHISNDKLTIEYFKKRSYGDGYNYARMVCNNEDLFIEDIISNYVLPRWSQYFNHSELSHIRQIISHEESTRIYIYNLMKCKVEFFKGIEDYLTQNNIKSYSKDTKGLLINSVSSESIRTW